MKKYINSPNLLILAVTLGLLFFFVTAMIPKNITVIQTNEKGDTLLNQTYNGFIHNTNGSYMLVDKDKGTRQTINGGVIQIKYNN